MNAKSALRRGEDCAFYDADNAGPSKDWAELAARAVLGDLTDRSGVGNELEAVDEDIKEEIQNTLADIIRNSPAFFEEIQKGS